jgi:hypothetical protein
MATSKPLTNEPVNNYGGVILNGNAGSDSPITGNLEVGERQAILNGPSAEGAIKGIDLSAGRLGVAVPNNNASYNDTVASVPSGYLQNGAPDFGDGRFSTETIWAADDNSKIAYQNGSATVKSADYDTFPV